MTVMSIKYFTHSIISSRGCYALNGYFINICLWFHSILHNTEYVFGWGIAKRQCSWINSANAEQHISYETPPLHKKLSYWRAELRMPNRSFHIRQWSFIYKQWRQILMEARLCIDDVITCNRGLISVGDVITLKWTTLRYYFFYYFELIIILKSREASRSRTHNYPQLLSMNKLNS